MSLDFDGINDLVNCGSSSIVNNVVNKTLMAWINADNYGEGNQGKIVSKVNWTFRVHSTGTISYQQNFATTNGIWRTANNSFNTGGWYHVAMHYVRANTANQPTFFINGSLQTTVLAQQPVGFLNVDNEYDLILGNDGSATGTFNGKIEDVSFHTSILEDEDISRAASSKLRYVALQVSPSTLAGLWPLDEFSNGTSASGTFSLRDISQNSHNGTPSISPIGRSTEFISYA